MPPNVATIRDNADAVHDVEATLSVGMRDLSLTAEYGHGATSEAIRLIEESNRHADLAVVAAAVGNAVMAAKHEAQAASAASDAARALDRAKAHAHDLATGLATATAGAAGAMGHAQSLVKLDDSSPAAEIHTKIAAQPETLDAMGRLVDEIQERVPGSRDPGELRVAAEHFMSLRDELEEGSGRAMDIAWDASRYGSSI